MAQKTHCPNCGVKLPDQPLSLCAYCAMPVDLAGDGSEGPGTESVHAERIARISENDQFEDAMQWVPPESLTFQRNRQRVARSAVVVGVAAVLVAISAFTLPEEAGLFTRPLTWLGLVVAAFGVYGMVRGAADSKGALALPLLRRAGMIIDRRSETEVKGWSGHTTYFFKIEFPDGVIAEFCYPGHGSNEEPYSTNLPGVAYTRGTNLLAFKHIRV